MKSQPKILIYDPSLKTMDYMVYHLLSIFANTETGSVPVSNQFIANETNRTKYTISRSISRLKERGYITKHGRKIKIYSGNRK